MGWSFRRSINFGPVRLNLSKSGVGYSIGGRGFRVGKDAKDRRYSQVSVPGTGIYNRSYEKKPPGVPAPTRQRPLLIGLVAIAAVLWILFKLLS